MRKVILVSAILLQCVACKSRNQFNSQQRSANHDDKYGVEFSVELSNEQREEFKSFSIGSQLTTGGKYKTQKDSYFIVEKLLGEGRRGRVYLVQNISSKNIPKKIEKYVIKMARFNSPEIVEAIASDEEKFKQLKGYLETNSGARPSNFYESGAGYALREFADGELLESWIKRWRNIDAKKSDPGMVASRKFFQESIQKKKYVGDLNRNNLIWSQKEERWIIIDSGGVSEESSALKVYEKFYNSVCRKWQKSIFSVVLGDSSSDVISNKNNPDYEEYHENCDSILGEKPAK